MAASRTLDQILTELRPTYDAQTKSLQERAGLIPQQIEAEEKGLQARQTQAFGDILGGARRRGLGFSGIPLAEQAQYTSTEFLPALARLRMSGREQAMSLQDAILGINERRDTLGRQIYQQEQDRSFQAREAQRQREFQARQAQLDRDNQRRAAAAAAWSPTTNLPTGGNQPKQPKTNPLMQVAYDDVYTRIQNQNDKQLLGDFRATAKSAGFGNVRDKYKLDIYRQLRPDLFKNMGSEAISNYSQLRF